jgi:hypothetical protein
LGFVLQTAQQFLRQRIGEAKREENILAWWQPVRQMPLIENQVLHHVARTL